MAQGSGMGCAAAAGTGDVAGSAADSHGVLSNRCEGRSEGWVRTEDEDIGDLLKQSEEDKKRADPAGKKEPNRAEQNGGVNARGNGGPPAGCPPAGGKPGNSGGQFNKNLRGANGAQTASTKLMPRRSISKDYDFRMDVENPKPGYAEGNIHVQLGGKGSDKYYWRGGTTFTTDKFEQLPKVARDYIDKNKDAVERAVNQGLKC